MSNIENLINKYERYNQELIEIFCSIADNKEYNIFERYLFYMNNTGSSIAVDSVDEKYFKFKKFMISENWSLTDLTYELLNYSYLDEFIETKKTFSIRLEHLLKLNEYEDTQEIIKFNDGNGKEILLTIAELKDFFEWIIKNRITHFIFEGRY